jgi:hypothetical protein
MERGKTRCVPIEKRRVDGFCILWNDAYIRRDVRSFHKRWNNCLGLAIQFTPFFSDFNLLTGFFGHNLGLTKKRTSLPEGR